MFKLSDILSLTEFKRQTNEFVRRLKKTGRPQVLTVNGRAELVVQDAASYEKLLEIVDRAEAIVGIREGLDSMKRNEARPVDEVFDELRNRLGIRADT